MSWLVRSLAAPFQEQNEQTPNIHNDGDEPREAKEENPSSTGIGVKEDLSELTNTLKRQFWGVAHFIAPPPSVKVADDPSPEDSDAPDRFQTDIPGRFKTGFSRISSVIQSLATDQDESQFESEDKISGSPKPVNFSASISEISRLASSFLSSNLGKLNEGDEDRVVGLTEEVLGFAADVTQHPGTWLDFPLDREDGDDFDMSDVQQEHALGVERHVPSLAALRIDLCPGYMSENRFWMIYFVLIHPRLSQEDALLLSTPPILEARALLSQELQRRSMTESSNVERGLDTAEGTSPLVPQKLENEQLLPITNNHEKAESIESVSPASTTSVTANNVEGDHQLSSMRETSSQTIPTEDLSLQKKDVMIGSSNQSDLKHDDEDQEVEDWLQEEADGHEAPTSNTPQLGNEEDVSFSDLEDDDDDDDAHK
ncbi:hypothetical protein SUGI_0592970 [Cryptomeria japonica]|uniref:uncharacterized protein LOC131051227 n=1 Tax=Cryptomeria japonica TaxID=3369 RepID=UPI002414A9F6|nr:uncharacterized protein LOC131051227 [Cryptomeria japonica]GLJ29995.1 hypothetical protein SUGI_0592970 [Cryptomeria japonica]